MRGGSRVKTEAVVARAVAPKVMVLAAHASAMNAVIVAARDLDMRNHSDDMAAVAAEHCGRGMG